MTTLSTHDTKRSDDVRARLAVLSEIPGRFGSAIQRWSRMNNAFRAAEARRGADAGSEYGVSVLPDADWGMAAVDGARSELHAEGGARGQKQQTSWVAN